MGVTFAVSTLIDAETSKKKRESRHKIMSGLARLVQYPTFEVNAPVLWTVSNGETSITKNCKFLQSGEKFQDQALVEYDREGENKRIWVSKKNLKADMTS